MAVKPITGMLRRGLVLDLSVAFGMPSLRARAPATPPEDGYAVSVDYGKRASKQAGSQMRCLSYLEGKRMARKEDALDACDGGGRVYNKLQ
jgi:hypothetical protein